MLDHVAIPSAPIRTTMALGLVLTAVLSMVAVTRGPTPARKPCAVAVPAEHEGLGIQTRTHQLNPRYLTRDRFGDPMLRR